MLKAMDPSPPPSHIDHTAADLLIDELVARYVAWREESAAVWETAQWCSAAMPAESGLSFAVYLAALDREEAAAAGYAMALERVRLLWPETWTDDDTTGSRSVPGRVGFT